MKRILSVLLLAALALSLFGSPALAEGSQPEKFHSGDGYIYILEEDGTAAITGYTGKEKKLVIPSQLDGHTVTSLRYRAFYEAKMITEVVIPDTVKTIGSYCFDWCTGLQSVSLPDGLESIGGSAFYYCKKLSKINIPDSVTKAGEGLFAGCAALKEITLSPDHPLLVMANGALFNRVDSVLLWYPASGKDKEYTVPEGTKGIGLQAFFETKVEKIVLPDSVEILSSGAFSGCDKLKTVNIPPKVTEVNDLFSLCKCLESIVVNSENTALESIDDVLFDKATHTLIKYPAAKKDKTFAVPEGTEIIGKSAFEYAGLVEITLPDSVRVIGSNAFLCCEKLKDILLPEGLETLESTPFQYCKSLTKVVLPASLKSISSNPFLNCSKLTEFEIAEGNTALELVCGCLVQREGMIVRACPAGIKSKKLEFPAGIRQIEGNAFGYCAGIEEIVFADGLEKIGSRAFATCKKLKKIVLPASLAEIDRTAFDMSKVKNTVFVVTPGSYAEEFCKTYSLKTQYAE